MRHLLIAWYLVLLWPSFVIGQTYAGGLYSMRSPNLIISSQDIALSIDQVKVTYTYSNTSDQSINQTMVFALPPKSDDNFKHFSVLVNQQPVQFQTMQRAISLDGYDITRELKAMGVPFNPISAIQFIDASPNRASISSKLRQLNLIDKREDTPRWIVKSYYYWQQDFPAKSNVTIEQTYKPAVLSKQIKFNNITAWLKLPIKALKKIYNVATTFSLEDESSILNLKDQFEKYNPQIQTYCPSKDDYRLLFNSYKAQTNRKSQIELKELHFAYNVDDLWANPVNNFSLTVESPRNMHPLICWSGGTKQQHNNTVRFTAENYVPLNNINIMFVEK
jgi:hypothetical protein